MRKFIFGLALAASVASVGFAEENVRGTLGALLGAEKFEEARLYLKAQGGTRNDMLLLEADIASINGNLGKVIAIYRELLAKYPADTNLRFQLVKVLFENKNYESASYHLQELIARTNDPELKKFFAAQLAEVSDYEKFGFWGDFGLTPSTNVNGANANATDELLGIEYEIPDELLPQFGWRANLGLSGYARARIADNQELVLRGDVSMTKYTVPTLDRASAEVSLAWKYQTARNTVSIAPFVRREMGDGESYTLEGLTFSSDGEIQTPNVSIVGRNEDSWTKGVRLNLERRLKDSKSIFLSAQYAEEVYDDEEEFGYADSKQKSLRIGYSFLANPRNRVSVWAGLSDLAQAGGDDNYDHWSGYEGKSVGASVETLFASGIRTEFTLQHTSKDFEGKPPKETTTFERQDYVNSLGITISNQNWTWGPLTPELDCQYSNVNSNYDDYSTNGTSCGISFTKSF